MSNVSFLCLFATRLIYNTDWAEKANSSKCMLLRSPCRKSHLALAKPRLMALTEKSDVAQPVGRESC